MREIIRINFNSKVKVAKIEEDGITLSNGLFLSDYHSQNCCENVYAGWKQLEDTTIEDEEFKELVISGNPLIGIVINGKYAVPCYNQQNGYYSSDLQIDIKGIDISEFVEDNIY